MRSEKNLIPVINRLSRQAKNADEAIELFQSLLADEVGEATLLMDSVEVGVSPDTGKTIAAFMESRQFPFRGLYTAPLTVGSRKVGPAGCLFRVVWRPGKWLPEVTAHVARQLSEILGRTSRADPAPHTEVRYESPPSTFALQHDRLIQSIAASAALWPDATAFNPVPAVDTQEAALSRDDAPIKALL